MSDKQFEFEGKKFDKEFENGEKGFEGEPEVEGHFFFGGEKPQFAEGEDKGFSEPGFSS